MYKYHDNSGQDKLKQPRPGWFLVEKDIDNPDAKLIFPGHVIEAYSWQFLCYEIRNPSQLNKLNIIINSKR